MKSDHLDVLNWGMLTYGDALNRQKALVGERVAGVAPDRLILVEHPPVVTVGRSGGPQDLNAPESFLNRMGIEVFQVERGGMATYHGPGQLVAYPIIKLRDRDLHRYLEKLLHVAAALLKEYGLEPELKNGRPGVWVNGGKIASVGIAVRNWVTFHGLALNVSTDLSPFNLIVPCGRPGQAVTSMKNELGKNLDPEKIKARFVELFREQFGYAARKAAGENAGRRPDWLVKPAPDSGAIDRMENLLSGLNLATVCQSAHCPNLGECFTRGTATFMILGTNCTRNCRFCAVDHSRPGPPDPHEPNHVARAAEILGLNHVVVTSVTRDDLPDGGAEWFAAAIEAIRRRCPSATVEVLIPDFKGAVTALDRVISRRPDVFNHNVETVPRLYAAVRPQAVYKRSLGVLEYAAGAGMAVKSGIMLGLGETDDEILKTLKDLRRTGCGIVTLGQYLPPSARHAPLARYVFPEEFKHWADEARNLGFRQVASAPLVRSSYRAGELAPAFMKTGRKIRHEQETLYR